MKCLLDTVVTLFLQDSSVPYNGFRVYLSYPPARQDRQSLRRVHLHLPFEAQLEGKGHTVAAPPLSLLLLAGYLDIWPIPLDGGDKKRNEVLPPTN